MIDQIDGKFQELQDNGSNIGSFEESETRWKSIEEEFQETCFGIESFEKSETRSQSIEEILKRLQKHLGL